MNTLVGAGFVLATEQMAPRLFDLDLQLIADASLMIIAVFALFLIASKLLFNPVRDMMQKRQEKIKGELDTAAHDMEEAAKLKADYESRIRNIEKEAEAILSEARKKLLRMRIKSSQRQKRKLRVLLNGRLRKRSWRRRRLPTT